MDPYWYKDAVIYAVDVEKYADGDGDGIGDFHGLLQRLDYIAELGATCLWVLPFYPSPRRDNGYDVSDYFGVDPRFGTLEDFVQVVRACGERGMRVLIDIVVNHTSDRHPWFVAARHDPVSRFHDYYIWADPPPAIPPGTSNAFAGECDRIWTYDEIARAYYYHRFYDFQPQLDMSNDEVRHELRRILDFWCTLGVSGFRIDALPIMFGHDPAVPSPRYPQMWLRELRSHTQALCESAALLGEVDLSPSQLSEYFGDGDGLHLLLDFFLDAHLFLALATECKDPILHALRQLPAPPHPGQWVNFLRNLDELNLGWLSEADRNTVYERFAPKQDMRIYDRGIRRRLAPMLAGDRRRIELVYSLLFSLPGTPMLVYGDEIGLGENLAQPGRDAVRVPMQWSRERNAGFSSAPRSRLVRPVLADGPFGYQQLNVADQERDDRSLLNWMRSIIRAWRSCPEFGHGSSSALESGTSSVMAHQCVWKDGKVIAVHNLSGQEQPVSLDLRDHHAFSVEPVFGVAHAAVDCGRCTMSLPPYGYQWVRTVAAGEERPASW